MKFGDKVHGDLQVGDEVDEDMSATGVGLAMAEFGQPLNAEPLNSTIETRENGHIRHSTGQQSILINGHINGQLNGSIRPTMV